MTQNIKYLLPIFLWLLAVQAFAQQAKEEKLWHGKERSIGYLPDGEDFVIKNGNRRFNRALYGTNTGFRVEAGDLPEFALYMPRMGGNFQFGVINDNNSKWLIKADSITARYRAGSMLYEIKDSFFGNGRMLLTALALADAEGVIIKLRAEQAQKPVSFFFSFGGASGKKFSRDGDIGADPESVFYLHPENCLDNFFWLNNNTFTLLYGRGKAFTEAERKELQQNIEKNAWMMFPPDQKVLSVIFPSATAFKIADATQQNSPLQMLQSQATEAPVMVGNLSLEPETDYYFLIQKPDTIALPTYEELAEVFETAEAARKKIAARVKIVTPDPYLNTLGGALSMAADAIYEDPTYLHGAVAWRMRLNAWRGAYVADPLGWHDRARSHFSSYIKSQLTSPDSAPVVADTALHLARHLEKLGTGMFTSGYICRNPNGDFRPHHYDMNLVFFDQMFNHFLWTGDLDFVREMWPAIKRHLNWEKRNFDTDDDGLYDAYCCIWASDALQYSGGGVTHSSSYNYRANTMAARLAKLLGEDPAPYQKEAEKILHALNKHLWLPENGWYGEYKDLLGNRLVHPQPGLWTIYHALDADVPNKFQSWQLLNYVDNEIPHIPIIAKGFPEGFYTLSTTNWQPYTWSVNNVALAEVLHTSLAYWQSGRADDAFKLWKGALTESMYLGASPGNFQQLSFYDAIRGELYRDFADPVGMAGRTLVEGLFGVLPDALNGVLTLKPGFPSEWKFASLQVPDISIDFKKDDLKQTYSIVPSFPKQMKLRLQVKAEREKVKMVTVNGKQVTWKKLKEEVGAPVLEIEAENAAQYKVEIIWHGNELDQPLVADSYVTGDEIFVKLPNARLLGVEDPQNILLTPKILLPYLKRSIITNPGNKTIFLKLQQGDFIWWQPVVVRVREKLELSALKTDDDKSVKINIKNNGASKDGTIRLNSSRKSYPVSLKEKSTTELVVPATEMIAGTNRVRFQSGHEQLEQDVVLWDLSAKSNSQWQKVDLANHYNDQVTNIFKNEYLAPRPSSPTLQLSIQGIGNWCYPLTRAEIDDAGLRKLAGTKNEVVTPLGVPFATPGAEGAKNVVFTSMWDNYPGETTVSLTGNAFHIYLLMAGTTNPMQSRFTNGEVIVEYTDNSFEKLELINPQTWWPIEQDYFTDGFAFTTDHPKPYRVYLKSGEITRDFKDFTPIKGFTNFGIDGGAATILDMPLNPSKTLKSIKIKAIANDVVIGLMAVTLKRE